MQPIQDLYKDLDYLSETVSTRTRTLDGVVIAVWWGASIGKEAIPGLDTGQLAIAAGVAVLSLIFDFLQYAIVYIGSLRLLRRLEQQKKTKFEYDLASPTYRFRGACFYVKQVAMVAAVLWLIVALAMVQH